jgi:AP-2 complex subunit alpha
LIADLPESAPARQFDVLQSKFATVSEPTKAILLSTYVKFCNMFPELKPRVMPIFRHQASQIDAELQQRSIEYYNLLALNDDPLLAKVCEVMPAFADVEEDVDDYYPGIPTTATMSQVQRRASTSLRRNSSSSGSLPSSPSSSQIATAQKQTQSPPPRQPSSPHTPTQPQQPHQPAAMPHSPSQPYMQATPPRPTASGVGHDSLIDVAELSGDESTTSAPSSPVPADDVSTRANRNRGQSVFAEDVNREFSSAVEAAKQNAANGGGGAVRLAPPPDQIEGATPEERAKATFRRLLILNQGVLYEDDTIQVGFKAEYQKGMGRMMLYFGNKTQQPLTSFALVIPPVGFLAIQTPQKPSPIVDPGTQQKFLIQMACQAPFNDTFAQITMSFMYVFPTYR